MGQVLLPTKFNEKKIEANVISFLTQKLSHFTPLYGSKDETGRRKQITLEPRRGDQVCPDSSWFQRGSYLQSRHTSTPTLFTFTFSLVTRRISKHDTFPQNIAHKYHNAARLVSLALARSSGRGVRAE